MDLLQTKENMDTLKMKLSDRTVFSMTIFTKGNPEDYLQHLIAVLHLIIQKRLNAACTNSAKELERASKVLEALAHNPIGPQGLNSKEDLEACKIEKNRPKKCLRAQRRHMNSYAISLPATRRPSNAWAGLNGEKHESKHPAYMGLGSRIASSYISSSSSQQMLLKGRSSTSSKGYKSPNGLPYVSVCLASRY
jgi:hypothetical protein